MLILSIIFPVLLGLGVLLKGEFRNRKTLLTLTGAGLVVTAALSMGVVLAGETELLLFSFGKNLDLYFHVDNLGKLFALVVNAVWMISGFYAFEYMNVARAGGKSVFWFLPDGSRYSERSGICRWYGDLLFVL